MKRLVSLLVTIALMMSVICAAALTTAQAAGTEYDVTENIDKIRTVGRAFAIDSGIACDWTASGIEFAADCEGDVSVTVAATCKAADNTNQHDNNKDCYYTVYVDGVRKDERLRIMSGTQTVTVATGLESGAHTFKIVKQNEGGLAQTTFKSITLNGTLGDRPADPEYVFEFIGDSITSGYGSLGTNNQSARYSDGTRTYAYVTAENFGAEARVTSNSGATIGAAYSSYKQADQYRTGMGDYQFDLKKPNAVVIALGTNDGAKTVEYWQTNLQKFMDLIRGGYNDYTIPFVFVHCIMDNAEDLRINVNTAFENLQKIDPEKYSYFYMTNGNRSGGHPNQSSHLFAAKKLTQCMVNNGIVPIDALKADATVTLTPVGSNSVSVNKFDSSSGLTIPSGITYEAVDSLDPADETDSTAKAAKFTADGTQTSGKIKLDTSSIKADGFRTKGISLYLNYKDTADYGDVENPTKTSPKLYMQASDKNCVQTLKASDGETTKVELTWDNMGATNYVFIHILQNSVLPTLYLELGTDVCEYTVDNVEVLLFDYAVYDNANATYKVLSSFPIIGVTDNYDIPSATTATTTSSISDLPKTYKTLFDADSDANAVTYSGSGLKSGSLGITDKEGLPYNTETGSAKLLKYMTAGTYNNPQVTFSGDVINESVQNSIGVRVWVAADKTSAAGGRSGVAFQFYDSVNNKTYFAGQWGSTKTALDTAGKWYTLYWEDFSTSSNKLAVGAAGGTVNANSIYKNITKITVSSGINGNGSWASLVDNNIYIDDLQFIYTDGLGNTETTSSGISATTAATASTTATPTTSVSGDEIRMALTAGQINYVQCKNSVSAKKTVGTADDDYLVKFDLASSIVSDKGFGISIPQSIFDEYSPTKIVYKLRADSTYDSGYAYLYFSTSSMANNQNAAPTESDTVVRYGNYDKSAINTTTTVKTVSASNAAHENIFKNHLNVAYFYNKTNPSTKTIYVEAVEIYYMSAGGTTEPTTAATTIAPTTTAAPTAIPTTVPTLAPTTTAITTISTTAPTTVITTAPTTLPITSQTVVTTENTTVTTEPTTAKPIIYGDVNGDSKINLLDLIAMRKHLAKWNITIDETAADCNADGKVNLLDLILMRKYLAKWDVMLGK